MGICGGDSQRNLCVVPFQFSEVFFQPVCGLFVVFGLFIGVLFSARRCFLVWELFRFGVLLGVLEV